MEKPRNTHSNASDSAPGVDDGPAGVGARSVDPKASARRKVWIGVIVVVLIIIGAFFARPTVFGVGHDEGGPRQVAQINPAAPSSATSSQQ